MGKKLNPAMIPAYIAGLMFFQSLLAADLATSPNQHPGTLKEITLASTADSKIPEPVNNAWPEVAAFGGGLADLGLHMLREDMSSSSRSVNYLVSPFGVATVLGMLHSGATGDTANEIAGLLQPSVNRGRRLGDRMRAAALAMDHPKAGVELISASRLWIDHSVAGSISPAYASLINRNYRSDGVIVNFRDVASVASTVNHWVTEATLGTIRELVTAEDLQPTTKLVATNVIYMKSAWAEPFSPAATRPMPFHDPSGQDIPVPTMIGMKHVGVGHYRGLQIIEIPYGDKDFAFYVALPGHPSHTLDALLQDVAGMDIAAWPQLVSPQMAQLYLPKFRIEPKPVSIKKALISGGMKAAFSDSARFEGIAGQGFLQLDNILHSAGIQVDESGTVAIAATAAIARIKSLPPPATEIHVDRPFLYILLHKPTATPLFVGSVSLPRY